MSALFRMTRRRALVAAALGLSAAPAALAAVAAKPLGAPDLNIPSLGALAARRHLAFGSAFDVEAIAIPDYGRLISYHSRILTTDNSLKFGSVRSAGPRADFADADRLIAFAGAARLPVRGHNLAWNEYAPDWLRAESGPRRAYWLDRHVDEICSRYAGRIQSWDVVNEPFWPDHGNPGGFRGGPWYDAMGAGYIERAFKRAAAADPNAKLALNEAGPEWAGPRGDFYRKAVLDTVRRLHDRGARVDIVGLECHWHAQVRFTPSVLEDYVGRLAEEGVDVYLTELDADDKRLSLNVERRDQQVAEVYHSIVATALRCPSVKAVITWQLADSQSWLSDTSVNTWGIWRRPRPLPFDDKFRAKAAYAALAKTFNAG